MKAVRSEANTPTTYPFFSLVSQICESLSLCPAGLERRCGGQSWQGSGLFWAEPWGWMGSHVMKEASGRRQGWGKQVGLWLWPGKTADASREDWDWRKANIEFIVELQHDSDWNCPPPRHTR